MICGTVRNKLPGYLDGALTPRECAAVSAHLEGCAACREELECYGRLGAVLARVEPVAPPADLAVRIRVAVSEARAARSWLQRAWSRAGLIFENILEPVAVPATGGLLVALLVFVVVVENLFMGLPLGAVPNDQPSNFFRPAAVESLANFPIITQPSNGQYEPRALVVQATVNARGEVTDYEILDGPDDEAVSRQVYQILLFSRFRPQMSFGRPEPGGRVLLQFTEIRVRG